METNNSLTLSKRVLTLISLASALALPAASFGTELRIETASLSMDPNANTWYVSSEICNDEGGGNSGSLLLELRLSTGSGTYYSLGSTNDPDVLYGNICRSYSGTAINVNTNVPNGTYNIKLVVGEYSNGSYIARDETTFSRTFIRADGDTPTYDPPGGDVCAENGWYGDFECDTFCPLPDPDCGGSAGSPLGGFGGGGSNAASPCGVASLPALGLTIASLLGWTSYRGRPLELQRN